MQHILAVHGDYVLENLEEQQNCDAQSLNLMRKIMVQEPKTHET
jgi:hypothetical protein